MILIIGGKGAGKTEYVQSLGYQTQDLSDKPYDPKPVLTHLEAFIRSCAVEPSSLLQTLLSKEVILCDEIGSGIIPADPADTKWRENVGYTLRALSPHASSVIRLICGIPVCIKGELP